MKLANPRESGRPSKGNNIASQGSAEKRKCGKTTIKTGKIWVPNQLFRIPNRYDFRRNLPSFLGGGIDGEESRNADHWIVGSLPNPPSLV